VFKLPFAESIILYLWLGSFIPSATHQVVGNQHVFVYSWAAKAHGIGAILLFAGAAASLWRLKKDKIGAWIFIVFIPVLGIAVWPQLFLERVMVTPTTLVYRREPPHTKYNADLAWDQMQSILEERHESGSFHTYWRSRYYVTMLDGQRIELPTSEMLTAGRERIHQQAVDFKIPYDTQIIPR
jgi:hypothetical protein